MSLLAVHSDGLLRQEEIILFIILDSTNNLFLIIYSKIEIFWTINQKIKYFIIAWKGAELGSEEIFPLPGAFLSYLSLAPAQRT